MFSHVFSSNSENVFKSGFQQYFLTLLMLQVFDYTIAFDKDFQAFAAPQPQPLPKYLALVNPFSPLVWVAIVTSVLCLSALLWLLAVAEGRLKSVNFKDWSSYGNSFWYCYSTLIGESVTRDVDLVKTQALR